MRVKFAMHKSVWLCSSACLGKVLLREWRSEECFDTQDRVVSEVDGEDETAEDQLADRQCYELSRPTEAAVCRVVSVLSVLSEETCCPSARYDKDHAT
jgi:hypothetical protein